MHACAIKACRSEILFLPAISSTWYSIYNYALFGSVNGGVDVCMLLQVFFAQLILSDMNKELKGLRLHLTLKFF